MSSVPLGSVKQPADSPLPEPGGEKPEQLSAAIQASKLYARQAIAAREAETARVMSRMEKRRPGISERQSMYLRLVQLRRVVYLREVSRIRAVVSLDLAAALIGRARQMGRSSRAMGGALAAPDRQAATARAVLGAMSPQTMIQTI
jgi:hypothetical protein